MTRRRKTKQNKKIVEMIIIQCVILFWFGNRKTMLKQCYLKKLSDFFGISVCVEIAIEWKNVCDILIHLDSLNVFLTFKNCCCIHIQIFQPRWWWNCCFVLNFSLTLHYYKLINNNDDDFHQNDECYSVIKLMLIVWLQN